MTPIPFNKPYLTGAENALLDQVLSSAKLSGDGAMTKACQAELERRLGSGRALLTTSCTDALEAAALLCDIEPGDEVIVPSYTFVSTANAFALRGATIVLADSREDHPNIDTGGIHDLITERTRAIVPVHYAGMACDMDTLSTLAEGKGIRIVEDAAQAIDSFYKGKALGTLGDLAAFSFHETKNIVAGEGGSLHINDPALVKRAEIVREKGTDRSAFFRGEVDKYGWVSLGSSYLPSELVAAVLLAQLRALEDIQQQRRSVWAAYDQRMRVLEQDGHVRCPVVPEGATNNAHMYYILTADLDERDALLDHLRGEGVMAVFHYQALHCSRYFEERHDGRDLPNAVRFTETLVRLPLYAGLSEAEIDRVCAAVENFYRSR